MAGFDELEQQWNGSHERLTRQERAARDHDGDDMLADIDFRSRWRQLFAAFIWMSRKLTFG